MSLEIQILFQLQNNIRIYNTKEDQPGYRQG